MATDADIDPQLLAQSMAADQNKRKLDATDKVSATRGSKKPK